MSMVVMTVVIMASVYMAPNPTSFEIGNCFVNGARRNVLSQSSAFSRRSGRGSSQNRGESESGSEDDGGCANHDEKDLQYSVMNRESV